MMTPNNLNRELLIAFLQKADVELKSKGYIPTIELLVDKLMEDDVKVEAQRLTVHTD